MGGLIARVLSFVRVTRNDANITDVKADPGGGPVRTAEHFAPPGDDSHPLPTDFVYLGGAPQLGRSAALGYVDPLNVPVALAGEKRLYARDDAGAVVAVVWLRNTGEVEISNVNGGVTLGADGSILGQNGSGSFELQADGSVIGQNGSGSFQLQAGGDFVVNGVTIAADGSVTIPSSLTLSGREISDHTHAQGPDSGNDTQQPTGPNL